VLRTGKKRKPARSEGEHVLGANRAGSEQYSAVDSSSTDFFRHYQKIANFDQQMIKQSESSQWLDIGSQPNFCVALLPAKMNRD
jgi:hypothetical protein